jgi:hydroxymethylbilane synthase
MSGVATLALTIGTRTSALARWQTGWVRARLEAAWPGLTCTLQPFTTTGDRVLDQPLPAIGGKGVFTAELEEALRAGTIDLAVHSLKDLPIADAPGLVVAAIPPREDAHDVLIAHSGGGLAALPPGARVGTSSLRRAAQLRLQRPDLELLPLRGNVDTRVRKLLAGDYDAIVLAAAGVLRLGLSEHIAEYLPFALMLPAPGQGALALQCRANDAATRGLVGALDDPATRAAVTAERAFLAGLGGGCAAPIAAYAEADPASAGQPERLRLDGLVASPDGRRVVRVSGIGGDAFELGRRVASEASQRGAADILADASAP